MSLFGKAFQLSCLVVFRRTVGLAPLRRPTSGYKMDIHEATPGARQRATAVQDPSDSLVLGLGSLGTVALEHGNVNSRA